jgi:hypothetical protein
VVTTRRRYKGKLYKTHLLRRTYREGAQVHNVTLANLSHLPEHLVDIVRRGLKGEQFVAPNDAFKVLSTRSHGHVAAVLGTIRNLQLDDILSKRENLERQRAVGMIAARIIDPRSKLATTRAWKTTTLPAELGIEGSDENDLYAAMDWLLGRQKHVEAELARRHLKDGALTFYDVTSTYFEGRCCPIAKLGHNRDGKKGKLQVVFGLLTNSEGCPVSVEVFQGNTADPKTLKAQITKARERFSLERVTLIGDRGMITSARIRDDLKGVEGVGWITALRAPQIQKLRKAGTIQLEIFDQRDLAEVEDPDYPGERLIVCRNPLMAEERKRKREELMQATERELKKVAESVRSGRLKDRTKIGLRVGRVIGRFKVGKLFRVTIDHGKFSFRRNQERIRTEAELDGFYVIRTSLPKRQLKAKEAVSAYKGLSRVERAFRCIKTFDLAVRPVFHWSEKRVKAHIFLCMLAYYVEWHMQNALAPMLFIDEGIGRLPRRSPVAPAQRSESAKWKDETKLTLDGRPVHSFRTLLQDLGSIACNKVSTPHAAKVKFDMLTEPTRDQRHVFKLLGVSLKV